MSKCLLVTLCVCSVLPPAQSHAGVLSEFVKAIGRAAVKKGGSEAIKRSASSTVKAAAKSSAGKALRTSARKTITVNGVASNTATNFGAQAMMESSTPKKVTEAALNKGGLGDRVMSFFWRNKAVIAGGTATGVVLANPEATLKAGEKFSSSLLENVAKPSIDGTLRHVVAPATGGTIVGVVLLFGTCILAVAAIFSIWRKTHQFRRIASFGAFLARPKF